MSYYCIDYNNGSNTTGDGSATAPWATVEYAETQINGGSGFIVGDEIRIAGSTKGPLIGTGTAESSNGRIVSLSFDGTTQITKGDMIWVEDDLGQEYPLRVTNVESNTIQLLSRRFRSPIFFDGIVNIYSISDTVDLFLESRDSYIDRVALTNNYGFASGSNSVTISAGFDPTNFTSMTNIGLTICRVDPNSSYNPFSEYVYGDFFRVGYINGFLFKNIATADITILQYDDFNIKGTSNVDNMVISYGYNRYPFRLMSNSSDNNNEWNNLKIGNAPILDHGPGNYNFTNNRIKVKNVIMQSGSDVLGDSNFQGFVLNSSEIKVEGTASIYGQNAILSRLLKAQAADNFTLDLQVKPGTKFKFQGYVGNMFDFNTVEYTFPIEYKDQLDHILGEAGAYVPGVFNYNGDFLNDFNNPFTRTSSSNDTFDGNEVFGLINNGAKIVDTTGEIYPAGWAYYRFNTVDQDTGDNCIEYESWISNNTNRLGLDITMGFPGDTISFTVRAKIKQGSTSETISPVLIGESLGSDGNADVLRTSYNRSEFLRGTPSEHSSSGTINDTTWTDITTTYTIPSTLTVRNPVYFAVKIPTDPGVKVLIDSYTYTIS